ncbi:Down syndrome cell adhesion molecule-like protein Dscam2 isoform X3 [Anopheles albimanus]|nr:Down syndrome cell adhesion molecule-like protein Dscam2 isoform X3 [Anopheles albimanus]
MDVIQTVASRSLPGILQYITLAILIKETGHALSSENLQMPNFLHELPSSIIFSNDTGSSHLVCQAYGGPQMIIQWILKDGSVVSSVPGLRQALPNGTLYFPPFAGHLFRTDVHDTTYRCRISYSYYVLLSHDIRVRAVVRQPYEVKVESVDVTLGNTAFLKCFISPHVREFVHVSSWYGEKEILLPGRSDIGTRYVVTTPGGELCIRNVNEEDRLKRFSCVTVDTLTGERKTSEAVLLTLKDNTPNMAPSTSQKSVSELSTGKGSSVQLPCNVQGSPVPSFSWFRISDTGSLYTVPSSQRIVPSQSLLFIRNADERDAGRWICKAFNQFGEQKLEMHLTVSNELMAHIHPQIQIINSGSSALLNCSIFGGEVNKIEWFHNGQELFANGRSERSVSLLSANSLKIDRVSKKDQGIYQCIVSNARSSAQGASELKLGESPPEISYGFVEQNVRPAAYISLKCSATGSPPPQFVWLLDYQPILDVSSLHRYSMDQFLDINSQVTTHLNISHVHSDDGGLYTCAATNSMGTAAHKARLNVYGPPYVRAIGPITAVAGEPIELHCAYSGHPIQSVRWIRGGNELVSGTRYSVADVKHGGYLKIYTVDPAQDRGPYTCIVTGPNGDEGRRELQLVVHSPAVIEPFSFPKVMKVGGRAQLTCSVSAGDMPIYFSWKKDGIAIAPDLHISEKKEEFFSLLVLKDITARHSGRYTCFATNTAAQTSYTAELLVQVPPAWTQEPHDIAVVLGHPIVIPCEADGFPQPKITWFRGKGKVSTDFHSIPSKNNSLSINYATSPDAGYYMCEAANGIGSSLKKIIHVDVNEAVHFESPVKNVSARRNDAVMLECLALGDEPINIIWTHKSQRIDFNNYRYNIIEMKESAGVRSQLSISLTERYDSGKYVCTAENLYGTSEHVIYLAVQERPDAPSDLEVMEVTSRSIRLSWKRPYDGMSPVLSYLVQYHPVKLAAKDLTDSAPVVLRSEPTFWESSQTVNVTFSKVNMIKSSIDGGVRDETSLGGLLPATQYLLRMLAINEIECSTFTPPVAVRTQEEAPSEAPGGLKVKAGAMGELVLTWQIPNRATWNGELLGYTVSCIEERTNINFIASPGNISNTTVTVHGWATTKTALARLKKFTRYALRIRTYNSIAPGPWSSVVYGTTLEDAPEAEPQNVSCASLSSQSIKVQWQEPPPQFHNGVLQGYKILYRPLTKNSKYHGHHGSRRWPRESSGSNHITLLPIFPDEFVYPFEIKRTSNLETYLHALMKATNYSIQVLSFTLSGDGVASAPVYCATEEDVPEAPAGIKALTLTADSILVSWLPPVHPNGIITHYTVYGKDHGKKGSAKHNIVRVDESGRPSMFEVRGLSENNKYDFWVTAATAKGEGDPTQVVSQTTNPRPPAKIASFSRLLKVPVGVSLVLECVAVGNPTPRTRWLTKDQAVTFSQYYVISQGFLKIHSVEPQIAGNFTCSAKNLFGEDEIHYTLIALQTPNVTQLSVQYTSFDSLRVTWEVASDGGAPIQGYTLYYRTATGTWSNVAIPSDQVAYTLNGLKCGTQYILKINAHNKVGIGAFTEEMAVRTKGKAPQIPEERELFSTNSTCLNLFLTYWLNGGCPISHFAIEYRRLHTPFWTIVSSDLSGTDQHSNGSISFCDFVPGTWYELKITSNNDAGKTMAQYNFATLTQTGERVPPPEYKAMEEDSNDTDLLQQEEFQWLQSTIMIVTIIVVVLCLVVVAKYRGILCFTSNADRYSTQTLSADLSLKEQSENIRNQQVYSASPVKVINNKDENSEMYEISPYATFNASTGRLCKEPRNLNPSNIDYSLQFRTFGHPECELNATAYPLLESTGHMPGHIKGKSSWHKQQFYNTDETPLNLPSSTKSIATKWDDGALRRMGQRNFGPSNYSESDSSSPINEFSNAPTFRIPSNKTPCPNILHHESSTESIKELSPVRDHRVATPRHVQAASAKGHFGHQLRTAKDNHCLDMQPSSSTHRYHNKTYVTAADFSETESDRERALDLEVQRAMEKAIRQDECKSSTR